MAKEFDTKRHAENTKRNIILRDLQRLPYAMEKNILQIIGVCGDRSSFFRTCITCSHFESIEMAASNGQVKETCTKFNALPPAKVIADGCESYVDYMEDDIPF